MTGVIYSARLYGLCERATPHYSLLSHQGRIRTARYRTSLLAIRYRYAKKCVLRRLVAGRVTSSDPSTIEFVMTEDGKPYMSRRPEKGICSSDAGDSFLFPILIMNPEIGVDVKSIDTKLEEDAIVQICFSHVEQTKFRKNSDTARTMSFFRTCVRKKAHVKVLGGGFSLTFQDVRVSTSPNALAVNVLFKPLSGEHVACGFILGDLLVAMPCRARCTPAFLRPSLHTRNCDLGQSRQC